MSQPIPALHNAQCFGCGAENPCSLGLNLTVTRERVTGSVRLDRRHEGAPGLAHGGVITAILDEALGAASRLLGPVTVTASLKIDFRSPAVIGARLTVAANLVHSEGRKKYAVGEVRDGRTLVAEASGLFVDVAPEHFARGVRAVAELRADRWL